MTPDERLARLIRATGPISLAAYMAEANAAYYTSRDPLGAAGDFITAPEVSQMFGELIGLWLADAWLRAGQPQPVAYVELGPGRGTLAADALRAMARFGLTPQVHFVESSPVLAGLQRAQVPDASWHADPGSLPEGLPLLVVANEFLDALPVRQLVRTAAGWRERLVGLDGARFVPVAGHKPMDAAVPPGRMDGPEGAIIETCPAAAAVVDDLARRLSAQGGAALLIDYGYTQPANGSSLQAVQGHRKVDPFAEPGSADLTALVDFSAMAEAAVAGGARHLGTVEQAAFLGAMGIGARAAALAGTRPEQAPMLARALERLTSSEQMGTLFKVMGLAGSGWTGGMVF